MTEKNNKGFSLVEVVIAVAILSLLLTPIIIQISQTIQVSGEAKEKQYAVENAEAVLEYFQKTDFDHLGEDGYVNVESEYVNGVEIDLAQNQSAITSAENAALKDTTLQKTCELVKVDGSPLATVKYSVREYTLNSVDLGKNKNTYKRVVTVDDLSNKILAAKYSVVYNLEESDLTDADGNRKAGLEDFVQTNEGSYVVMDSTNTYVTKIVCKAQNDTYSYTDPNEVNLGYVQDLDASKVAIIQGVASNTDNNAETALFALKMQNLKDVNYDEWQTQMDHVSGEGYGSLNKEDTNKLTVVTTSKPNGASYYVVSCDVYYTSAYQLNKGSVDESVDFTDSVHYNVFSQKFYTTEAPDIYFVYEPFVIDSDNGAVYTPDDYIAIDNDDATADAKLYLIMPDESQLSVKADSDNDVKGIYTSADYVGQDTLNYKRYLRRSDNTWKTVNLHFFRLVSTASTPLQIYTNLAIRETDTKYKQTYDCVAPLEKNSDETYKIGAEATGSRERENYEDSYLHTLTEDTRYSGRLYTATVQLYKMNGDTAADTASVRFQGGKGAN